ncbi:MAG: prolyl oligopeptidase family serine peptidase, partial [Acidobacteria bacterium]|nr:prolyl oligopeptidase family serine peptidase [Acidobacteriota bacterium]
KSPRPLLIYLYGAGGSLDFYNLGSGPYTEMRKLLADRGYYILVPGLGPMHWMNREARAKLDRVVDRVLADYPIQRKRVFLMGASMGGGSSLAYAIHRPKLIRAACSHMGMTDFRQWYQDEPRRQKQLAETFGGTPDTAPAAFAEVSAMANIRVFRKIPLFLVYAADDKVVLPAHGRQLYDAVRKQGGTAILRIAPGVAHKNESIMPYQQEIMEFFDRAR